MSADGLARVPEPPYWAVIFTSRRRSPGADSGGGAQAMPVDDAGYQAAAERMVALAAQQPGYLGIDSVRGADQVGITVSYWADLESIAAWRRHSEHVATREAGRAAWYDRYELRIARVERAYGWTADLGTDRP